MLPELVPKDRRDLFVADLAPRAFRGSQSRGGTRDMVRPTVIVTVRAGVDLDGLGILDCGEGRTQGRRRCAILRLHSGIEVRS